MQQDAILTTGRVDFNFTSPLVPPTSRHILYMSLNTLALPRSWHAINPYNNTFTVDGLTVTLTPANYSAISLASAMQSAIRALGAGYSTFAVTYNQITNKFTFTHGSVFTLGYNEQTRRWLGMTRGTTELQATYDGISYTATSTQVADLSYTKCVRTVFSVVSTDNADQGSENLADLVGTLAVLPVTVGYQGIITYDPTQPIVHPIARPVVESLTVSIADDDGNPIYMNGADWEAHITLRWAEQDQGREY